MMPTSMSLSQRYGNLHMIASHIRMIVIEVLEVLDALLELGAIIV